MYWVEESGTAKDVHGAMNGNLDRRAHWKRISGSNSVIVAQNLVDFSQQRQLVRKTQGSFTKPRHLLSIINVKRSHKRRVVNCFYASKSIYWGTAQCTALWSCPWAHETQCGLVSRIISCLRRNAWRQSFCTLHGNAAKKDEIWFQSSFPGALCEQTMSKTSLTFINWELWWKVLLGKRAGSEGPRLLVVASDNEAEGRIPSGASSVLSLKTLGDVRKSWAAEWAHRLLVRRCDDICLLASGLAQGQDAKLTLDRGGEREVVSNEAPERKSWYAFQNSRLEEGRWES